MKGKQHSTTTPAAASVDLDTEKGSTSAGPTVVGIPPEGFGSQHDRSSSGGYGGDKHSTMSASCVKYRRAVLAGLVLFVLWLVADVLLYLTYADTSLYLGTQPLHYSDEDMHVLGLVCYAGCALSLLVLAVSLAVYCHLKPVLSARGRFPPFILWVASGGYFMCFFINANLLWSFSAVTVPAAIHNERWWFFLAISIPTWTSRGFAILPTTYLMLRIIFVYYGTPRLFPPSWGPHSVMSNPFLKSSSSARHFFTFLAIAMSPMMICFVLDVVSLIMSSDADEHINSNISYFLWFAQDFIQLVYGAFDLWCVVCLFLIRRQLRAVDMDVTRFLVCLSMLYSMQVVLSSVKYGIVAVGVYYWPHALYVALLFVQSALLYTLFFLNLNSMVHRTAQKDRVRSGQTAGCGGGTNSNHVSVTKIPSEPRATLTGDKHEPIGV